MKNSGIYAYDESPNREHYIKQIKDLISVGLKPYEVVDHLENLNNVLEKNIFLYKELSKLSPLAFIFNEVGIAGGFVMLGYAVNSELYLMRGVKMYQENKKLIEESYE
jgi:hypothetical protein